MDFADQVRVIDAPETRARGIAGMSGPVYGFTTPSMTGVEMIGDVDEDFAIAVQLEAFDEVVWIHPSLLERIDHGAGAEIVVGNARLVKSEAGEWIESRLSKPWWRFWR